MLRELFKINLNMEQPQQYNLHQRTNNKQKQKTSRQESVAKSHEISRDYRDAL